MLELIECLKNAKDNMRLTRNWLVEANEQANATQGIIILDLLKQANQLTQDISNLINAINADDAERK